MILNQLRIEAEIVAIDWSNIIDSRYPPELRANYLHMDTPMLPDEYVKGRLSNHFTNLCWFRCMLPLDHSYVVGVAHKDFSGPSMTQSPLTLSKYVSKLSVI